MSGDEERERLRLTFTEDAELYDRVRPGYPARLFDDLARYAELGARSRVLEVGCGTGKATVPLAERGYRVQAVELGAELAAVTRRRLAGFPDVAVTVGAFEEWALPAEPFDLVIAATAFHWLDPAVRVPKAADALRPGGTLAVVSTHHVAGGTLDFFAASQEHYERFVPGTPPGLRLEPADAIPRDGAELAASGRFGPAAFHRYEWELDYTTREYLDLLCSYSNHRALPAESRAGLLRALGGLIDGAHGGRVTKRYLTELLVARRL
ncbi:class I SAM-dependent methyltransferase [Kitasatospora viridis]|uniref:Methyltransferase family protein n=1 Tax=Kitasatospora viridis TaxID=281105 RepID=A0A561T753_9ACTN|nr:class I SAM-dependent methyltransferase [Kitasatospora viridis]TWF82938.1 methyltransferase family protein [Kitasatospora viridis]